MQLNVEAELLARLEQDAYDHLGLGERDWYTIFGATAHWFMNAVRKAKPTWSEMTATERKFFTICWEETQEWLARQTKH
jgi:hypothetical protein